MIAIPNPNTYPAQENTDFLKKKQILYVGRIEWRQKRVGRLIDIWKRIYKKIPDWELVICGRWTHKAGTGAESLKDEAGCFHWLAGP